MAGTDGTTDVATAAAPRGFVAKQSRKDSGALASSPMQQHASGSQARAPEASTSPAHPNCKPGALSYAEQFARRQGMASGRLGSPPAPSPSSPLASRRSVTAHLAAGAPRLATAERSARRAGNLQSSRSQEKQGAGGYRDAELVRNASLTSGLHKLRLAACEDEPSTPAPAGQLKSSKASSPSPTADAARTSAAATGTGACDQASERGQEDKATPRAAGVPVGHVAADAILARMQSRALELLSMAREAQADESPPDSPQGGGGSGEW